MRGAAEPDPRRAVAPRVEEVRPGGGAVALPQVGPVVALGIEPAPFVAEGAAGRRAEALLAAGLGEPRQDPGDAGRAVAEAGERHAASPLQTAATRRPRSSTTAPASRRSPQRTAASRTAGRGRWRCRARSAAAAPAEPAMRSKASSFSMLEIRPGVPAVSATAASSSPGSRPQASQVGEGVDEPAPAVESAGERRGGGSRCRCRTRCSGRAGRGARSAPRRLRAPEVGEEEGDPGEAVVEVDRHRLQEPSPGAQVEMEPGHDLLPARRRAGPGGRRFAGPRARKRSASGGAGLGQARRRPGPALVEGAGGLDRGLDASQLCRSRSSSPIARSRSRASSMPGMREETLRSGAPAGVEEIGRGRRARSDSGTSPAARSSRSSRTARRKGG